MKKIILLPLVLFLFSMKVCATTVIAPGETIYPGQYIQSQNGDFSFGIDPGSHRLAFYFQYPQNGYYKTMYDYLSPNWGWGETSFYAVRFWPTENRGEPGLASSHMLITTKAGDRLVMQGDGNLVLYSGGEAVWSTNTGGHPGAYAVVENFGDIGIYEPASSEPIMEWPYTALLPGASFNSQSGVPFHGMSSRVNVGVGFMSSQDYVCGAQFTVVSVTPGFPSTWCGIMADTLTMREDGNLVFYRNGENVLQSGTAGYSNDIAVFSPVGILIAKPQGGVDSYMPYPVFFQWKPVKSAAPIKPPTNSGSGWLWGFLHSASCYVTLDGGLFSCYPN